MRQAATTWERGLAFYLSVTCAVMGFPDSPRLAVRQAFAGEALPQALTPETFAVSPEEGTLEQKQIFPDSRRFIILLKDAHAVPEAQYSMARLVESLAAKHGLQLTALEGVSGSLDSLLLQQYPDKKGLRGILKSYLDAGEISGPAAASIFTEENVRYEGLEEEGLYEASVDAFLEAASLRKTPENRLAEIKRQIALAAKPYFSPELKKLVSAVYVDSQNKNRLESTLTLLKEVLPADFQQGISKRYPHAALLLDELGKSRSHAGEIRAEIARLEQAVAAVPGASLPPSLAASRQAYETETLSAPAYARELAAAAHDLGLKASVSVALQKAFESEQKLRNLQGGEFIQEYEALLKDAFQILSKGNPAALYLLKLFETVRTLSEWLRLELSPNGWRTVQSVLENPESLNPPENLSARETELAEELKTFLGAFREKENPWKRFYILAGERDTVFLERLASRMETSSTRTALLAAGGFHAEALSERLAREKISFAVVVPAVPALPENNLYTAYMQGDVSWKQFFSERQGRVNVYDAFQQSVIERLTESLGNDPGRIKVLFKEWRDQVIRRLAAENRLAEAGQYTRFLDTVLWNVLNEREKKQLKTGWNDRLDSFIERLYRLKEQNRLTPESIARLPVSGVLHWQAAKAFSPSDDVPAAWTQGKAAKSLLAAGFAQSFQPLSPPRAELRTGEEPELPEPEREEILYDEPLQTPWKMFGYSVPLLFFALLTGFYTQAVPRPSLAQAFVAAVMFTGLYVLGAGSILINYERNMLRQQMREKMIPAPKFETTNEGGDVKRTVIDVPELFRAEPGERFPVEKFVNTALHALELIPSQVISIWIGAQKVYERGEGAAQLQEIMDSAQNFNFGNRPDYQGPVSLRLTIFHGPALRSELRTLPPVTQEQALLRFQTIRNELQLGAGVEYQDEEFRKTRIRNFHKVILEALNGLILKDGYQLRWSGLDFLIVHSGDEKIAGNLGFGLIYRDGRLAADVGYDILPGDRGKGLVSIFNSFLAQALPENIPLVSGIDNIPTLLALLERSIQDAEARLSDERLERLRALRVEYSEDFDPTASAEWRSRVRRELEALYREHSELMPGVEAMMETQLGRINLYYGNARTRLVLNPFGSLDFEALRGGGSQDFNPAEASVLAGILDFRSRMTALIDSKPFDPDAKSQAENSYTAFVKKFALQSGIRVKDEPYVSRGKYYRAQWGNVVVNFKGFFRDLFRGNFKGLPGHVMLGANALLNLLFVAAGVPAIVLDDEKGELKQLIFVNKIHFYLPGVVLFSAVYRSAPSALRGALTFEGAFFNLILGFLFYFAFSSAAAVLNFFSRGFGGHEMTHVLQFGLMERLRTDLDLPVSFMEVYKDFFTHADLEAPPMTSITRRPPTAAQLKEQVRRITDKFLERAETLEAARTAARESQEKWESEKRVNSADTYHKVQVLLEDVKRGLEKGILKSALIVEASGERSYLHASENPELASDLTRRVLAMRREAGYTYSWSLGHQRLMVIAKQPPAAVRAELRADSLEEEDEFEFGNETKPGKIRYNNGVHQRYFNQAVSLLKRARRDQHTPDADLTLLEEAEFKIHRAFRLMQRIRGRAILPAYIHRRAILERNLGNLLAANYVRQAIWLRDHETPEAARKVLDKAVHELNLIEDAGTSDTITNWTRAQVLRQTGLLDFREAQSEAVLGHYETALNLFDRARRGLFISVSLYESGSADERAVKRAERELLEREIALITEKREEARLALRRAVRGSGVEFRLMGSDFTQDEPFFLAGLRAPYPVLGRAEKSDLFSDWAFFDRYADPDGSIRWDIENDVFIAYLGGQPAAAWAFQADTHNLSLQGNGLYVNPALRGSGLGIVLARRLFQMLKNQGFKTFQIGPVNNRGEWGIDKTPEAQAFHRSLIRRLGKNGVRSLVRYPDGQIQGMTVDLQRMQFSSDTRASGLQVFPRDETPKPRSELRSEQDRNQHLIELARKAAEEGDDITDPEIVRRVSALNDAVSQDEEVFDHLTIYETFVPKNIKEGPMVRDLDDWQMSDGPRVERSLVRLMDRIGFVLSGENPLKLHHTLFEVVIFGLIHPSEKVRYAAIRTLAEFPAAERAEALPVLREIARKDEVPALILMGLIKVFEKEGDLASLSEILRQPGTIQVARSAVRAIGGLAANQEALDRLISLIFNQNADPKVVETALNALARGAGFDVASMILTAFILGNYGTLTAQAEKAFAKDLAFRIDEELEIRDPDSAQAAPLEALVRIEGELPSGQILHELGNIMSLLELVDSTIDPLNASKVEEVMGTDFYKPYASLKSRYSSARSMNPGPAKEAVVLKLLQDLRDFFAADKIQVEAERIRKSSHPKAEKAADQLVTQSAWVYQFTAQPLGLEVEALKMLRPLTLLRDAVSGFESTGEAVVEGETTRSFVFIRTYPLELYRALRNLVINAAHATEDNPPERPRRITLKMESLDSEESQFALRITVRDNGTGIPEDVLPRIFEPLFTTKGSRGSGLGLALTKESIENSLGGKISVETKTGEGTVFTIDLPSEAPVRSELRAEREDFSYVTLDDQWQDAMEHVLRDRDRFLKVQVMRPGLLTGLALSAGLSLTAVSMIVQGFEFYSAAVLVLLVMGLFQYSAQVVTSVREMREVRERIARTLEKTGRRWNTLLNAVVPYQSLPREFIAAWYEESEVPQEKIETLLAYLRLLERLDEEETYDSNPAHPGDILEFLDWRIQTERRDRASVLRSLEILQGLMSHGVLNESGLLQQKTVNDLHAHFSAAGRRLEETRSRILRNPDWVLGKVFPHRSELRSQGQDPTRRDFIRWVSATATGLSALTGMTGPAAAQQKKAPADQPRQIKLPVNPFLRRMTLRPVYRDTQISLLSMRSPVGMPYNQGEAPRNPVGTWLRSADIGFMWSADLLAALSHSNFPIGDRGALSDPKKVTERITKSLEMFEKMVDQFGLRINGVNTGLLPETLVYEKEGAAKPFKTELMKIPGKEGQTGVAYAAYDMALTHVRLKLLAEVFKGGYVRGLKDETIVKKAEALLAKADYRGFLDKEGRLRSQVFVNPADKSLTLNESFIDNRHTEARDFFLMPEVLGDPEKDFKTRRAQGLEVLKKLRHEWVEAAGTAGDVPIGNGDANLSAWTEYEGLQFLDPAKVSPAVLAVSSKNYFQAARAVAKKGAHVAAVSAPGSGEKADSYAVYGLKDASVLVAAGPFLALLSDVPESVDNAEAFVRAVTKRNGYRELWGLGDSYNPKTGAPYHEKRIYMNQGLILEALGAPFLRAVVAEWEDYPDIAAEFQAFDRRYAAVNRKDLDLLAAFTGIAMFTNLEKAPDNMEKKNTDGSIQIAFSLDNKNRFSGFTGNFKAADAEAFKSLRIAFSKESVLPDKFEIELSDDSPAGKVLGTLEVSAPKPGEALVLDLSSLPLKGVKTAKIALVFEIEKAGKTPKGVFTITELALSPNAVVRPKGKGGGPVPKRGNSRRLSVSNIAAGGTLSQASRAELRALPDHPETETLDRSFHQLYTHADEILQYVDPATGEFLTAVGQSKLKAHQEGEWHAVTQVYVFDKNGKLFLQERSMNKDMSPGKLQVSAGGHVNLGESRIQAAIRETEEEIRLKIKPEKLLLLSPPNGFPRESFQGGLVNREWVTIYAYILDDEEKASLAINLDEISRGFFFSMPFFETLTQDYHGLLSGSLKLLVDEHREIYEALKKQSEQAKARSELRLSGGDTGAEALQDVVRTVLEDLALGRNLRREAAAVLAEKAQRQMPAVESALREQGQDPHYASLLSAGSEPRRAAAEDVQEVHPDYDTAQTAFYQELLAGFERDVRKALSADTSKKLVFAFGYRLPRSEKARAGLLNYLRTLGALRDAFPSQLTAKVKVMVLEHEMEDPAVKDFFQEAGSLGVATPVEMNEAVLSASLAGYLHEFGSALVYGLPDAELLSDFSGRAVLSEVEAGEELPVVILLSRMLAEDGKTRITAERLKKLSEFLPGILQMQGSRLRITRLVLEIAFKFSANRLIQSAA